MHILLPGQHPRSETLVAATRDFERGRIALPELEKAQKRDLKDFLALQRHFPYQSPGLFHWHDMLRPFCDLLEDVQVGTMVRFYETNTFWHQLESNNNPSLAKTTLESWLAENFLGQKSIAVETPMVFTLPFLFLFKDYSHGLPLELIAALLEKVAKALATLPNKVICFFDPTFGWRSLSQQEKEFSKKWLETLKRHITSPIYLWTCFFPLKQEREFLYSLPVDGFGIDFYANSIEESMLQFPKGKTLIAGVINTDSTLVEPKQMIAEFIKRISTFVPKENIYLSPNAPAELLPRSVMDRKVKNLLEIIS